MNRIAGLSLILCACAPSVQTSTTPVTSPQSTISDSDRDPTIRLGDSPNIATVVIDAPLDSVWRVLPAIYTRMEIAPEVSERTSAVFGTRAHTASRIGGKRTIDMLRCPNSGAGSAVGAYRARISVLTTLADVPGGKTGFSTEVSGTATSVEGTSTGAMRCISTGEIEKRLVSLANEALGRAR